MDHRGPHSSGPPAEPQSTSSSLSSESLQPGNVLKLVSQTPVADHAEGQNPRTTPHQNDDWQEQLEAMNSQMNGLISKNAELEAKNASLSSQMTAMASQMAIVLARLDALGASQGTHKCLHRESSIAHALTYFSIVIRPYLPTQHGLTPSSRGRFLCQMGPLCVLAGIGAIISCHFWSGNFLLCTVSFSTTSARLRWWHCSASSQK